MFYQIHFQFKNGITELVSQSNIHNHDELKMFIEETKSNHPLPSGAIYMCCNKKSKHFVKTYQRR